MADAYLWLKALHIIAVITWMAGLFYLPRLYVYHVDAPAGSVQSETFKVMERKLLRYITNPAMIVSLGLGIALLMVPGLINWKTDGWMHAKLTLVLGMVAYHGFLARWRKDFERDQNRRSGKFYRLANEIPTILMILIVLLVVVKPF